MLPSILFDTIVQNTLDRIDDGATEEEAMTMVPIRLTQEEVNDLLSNISKGENLDQ